jgi:hypothetical protein
VQAQDLPEPAVGPLGGDRDGRGLTRAPVGVLDLAVRALELREQALVVALGLAVQDPLVVHLSLQRKWA